MAKKMRKMKGAKPAQIASGGTGAPMTIDNTKAPVAGAGGSGSKKASPQQQALYDMVMVAARKVIYGQGNDDMRFQMVLKRLKEAGPNVAQAIGGVTAVILTNVAGAAQKQGRTVPPEILVAAGREIIADLIEIAISAKLLDKSQAAQVNARAIIEAFKAYRAGNAPKPPAAPATPATPPAASPAAPPAGIIAGAQGA